MLSKLEPVFHLRGSAGAWKHDGGRIKTDSCRKLNAQRLQHNELKESVSIKKKK